jgi:signal transduction histidine kinase
MTRLSIRWRLTLWYGVSLAVLLCGFCLILMLLMRQQVFVRTDAGLREEVKELGVEIGLAENAAAFKSAATARFGHHEFYDFLVSDDEGRAAFASSDRFALDELSTGGGSVRTNVVFTTLQLGELGPYRIATAFLPSKFGRLKVQVLRSLTPLYSDLQALQWVMTGLLPIGVLLALGVGHFLAGRALAPVQHVVEVANAIDITCLDRRINVANPHDEIGRLSLALNSLIVRLEQAVSEIRRFTADASHEIRTPLAVLRAEAEAALRSSRSPDEYARALGVIVDEAARLGRLADQLLHLSRYDAGITHCAQEPVPLEALLQDVTEQLQPLAADRQVTLHCELNVCCEVLGDDIRLSQVFFNVLENAIKYAPGGKVAVRLRLMEQWAVVDVEDNGEGIPDPALPRVFERFYRVDSSRQRESGGAGLGLSIARATVLAHQGTIEIQSQVGVGTIVTIRLPAVRAPVQSDSNEHPTVASRN